ncbi:MAG: TonB-dependent receptor plug domain-containing protein [Vicinamibacterales bacterium]
MTRAWVRTTAVMAWLGMGLAGRAANAQTPSPQPTPAPAAPAPAQPGDRDFIFDLGEIVVVGTTEGTPGVGGAILTRESMWTFDRQYLDQAVNMVPGVVSTFDANGRRNESDVFVRGFGRWQVPLMMDGVRIYLPADNRLDFARFLTADVAAVQVQKGYASVIDGPGGMGGAINLVTRKPTRPLEVEGAAWLGGRDDREAWSGYAMAGTRHERFYAQGSLNASDRDFWTLSSDYAAPVNSLQPGGRRVGSDSRDWRVNAKVGFTPNTTDEYTVNYTRQEGEKGAPLNVNNNPPVPPNSYWRWPYWDLQNVSFLSRTQLTGTTYAKTRIYYNTFENGLEAYDDGTYTLQSANGRFFSPYDDHAYGGTVEVGTTAIAANTLKAAAHYRADFHSESQVSRPTHPTASTTEPTQEQEQHTWSLAVENTFRASASLALVAGVSVESYAIDKAQEFSAARGLFEYPRGGADSFNWQGAAIWYYTPTAEVHASVSNRARFPVIFELYSTRFGTATPNPDLGPERATNLELGWKGTVGGARLEGAVFYSDVRDLIQTVVLPDATTQTRNVGDGEFYGAEVAGDLPLGDRVRVGGNYTWIRRTITDALQPNLRPTGVPTHKAFVHATFTPVDRLAISPSLDLAGDRWSDVNPAPAFPYVRTGAYTMLNLSAQYTFPGGIELMVGGRNLTDDNFELAWGFPQPGRTFFVKTRIGL